MEPGEKQTTTEAILYYVQDTVRGSFQSMAWWKKGNHGYTCDLKKARAWTKEEMVVTCADSRDLRAWPKAYIDKFVENHIIRFDVDPKHAECIDY